MSDWGRSGSVSQQGGGGSGLFVLGLVLGMVLFAGLGYGAYQFGFIRFGTDERELSELRDRVATLREELAQARSQGGEIAPQEARELLVQIENLRRERDALVADRPGLEEARLELQTLREERLPELQRDLQDRNRRIGELEAAMRLAEQVNRDLQASLDSRPPASADEVEGLRAQIANRDEVLRRLDDELAASERELAQLKRQLDAGSAAQGRAGEAATREIADLKKALGERDALLSRLDGEITTRDRRIVGLQDEIARQEAALRDSDADKALASEVERQRAALEREARARETLEAQLRESTATIARLEEEVATASRGVSQSLVEREAELNAARATAEELRRKLDEAVAEAGQAAALRGSLRDLQTQLDQASAEAQSLAPVVIEQKARIAALEQQETRLRAEASQLRAQADRVAGLETEIRQLQGEAERARQQSGAGSAAAQELRARIATLESELSGAREESAALREQVASLQQREGSRGQTSGGSGPDHSAGSSGDEGQRPSRDPLRVAAAIREASGLDSMSDAERDRLAIALIEGACVATALSETFGRAPAVPLRDLIRALDSDC